MTDRGFIDVASRFGPDAGRSRGTPLAAMLAEARSHGVHLTLAHSRVAVDYASEVGNADALAVASDPSNRVRAVAVVDASVSRDQAEPIRRLAAAGVAGFVIESREGRFALDGESGRPRLKAIADTGLPLFVPIGSTTDDPSAVSRLAQATDGLGIPVVLVGVHYSNATEALEVAQNHDHLHVETSRMAHFGAVETAVDRIGHERVLFASGGPGRAMQSPLNMVLLAEIPDDAKRAILAGNAARLLGIAAPDVDLTPPSLPRGAFDVHTHYMPASAYDLPIVPDDELLPRLRTWGTTTVASSSFNAFAADLIAGNRETVDASRADSGQGGLLVLDPADFEASRDALARWRHAPGIRGVKIHSYYSGVATADPRMAALFDLAGEHRAPVKIHNDGPDWHVALASYARAHPEIPILLAHSGPGAPSLEGARLAAEHESVFLELGSSFANLPTMRELVRIATPAKVAWGTDAPLIDPRFVLGSYMDAGLGPLEQPGVYRDVPNRIFGTTGSAA